MIVYWELAFLENFTLDALLVYLALKCARQFISKGRLLLSAAVGGLEGVLFPIFSLPTWATCLVKILGGLLLVVLALRKWTVKNFFIASICLFGFTMCFGGALFAVYEAFGVKYQMGDGYVVESVPIALLLSLAVSFVLFSVKIMKRMRRFRAIGAQVVSCEIRNGERVLSWQAFVDSGNRLTFRGQPVCLTSAVGILALFGDSAQSVGRIVVNTVNGAKDSPVFRIEAMKVTINGEECTFRGCYFTTGAVVSDEYQMILHTEFLEGKYETVGCVKKRIAKDKGERKRRSLSLRKRSSAVTALGGRGNEYAGDARSRRTDRRSENATHRT